VKYKATERACLNADQRLRYEEACRKAPRHYRTGRLYDGAKAEIAERILFEDVKAATGRYCGSKHPHEAHEWLMGWPIRMDRLRAVGDGQVPAVVRRAWETFSE
jgi:hypothetical protein